MYIIRSKNTISFLAKQRRKLHVSFMTEVTDVVLQTELYKQVISPTNFGLSGSFMDAYLI